MKSQVQHRTPLGTDVPIDLAVALDEMARVRKITRSDLVRDALASFAGGIRRIEWLEIDSVMLRRKIKYRLDIDAREFKGRAGMPWLIMAANTHLSINALLEVMALFGYERTRSWVQRRRWIFQDPEYVRAAGGVSNADGQDDRARQIMESHGRTSARELARILRERGIARSKDWVLRNRFPATSVSCRVP